MVAVPSYGQKVDFDRVVTPVEMGTRNFKEYLVQLAWMNSPENDVLVFQKEMREFELKSEKKDWMDDIRFSVNLNENNLNRDTVFIVPGTNPSSAQNTNLFPIFNLNASVSLGTFTNRKNRVGAAESRVKMAESNVNQKKLNVRLMVLQRYEEYEMQQEILKATSTEEEDTYQAYILITDLFKADKANLEDYLQASTSYHSSVQKRIKANADVNIAKLRVEELIGISLEDANRMRK